MPFLENIDQFSRDFKQVLQIVSEISNKRELIKDKLARLKIQYNGMVKGNQKKIFLFCLDSFFYQYKIYSVEVEQIEASRKMVNNRMYCEYYKLYGIVVAYLGEINLSYENKRALLKEYPVYKDLDPTVEYELRDVENIYDNILLLLGHLNEKICRNNGEIDEYKSDPSLGLSISNFVSSLRNENLMMQGQIDLFTDFLSFFLGSQKKQYERIYRRLMDFFENMNGGLPKDDVVDGLPKDDVVEGLPKDDVVPGPKEKVDEPDIPRPDMAFE